MIYDNEVSSTMKKKRRVMCCMCNENCEAYLGHYQFTGLVGCVRDNEDMVDQVSPFEILGSS